MAICLDALIYFGKQHYHSTVLGASIALSAFALMLIIAAFESRNASRTALASATFDNPKMNWTAVAELALAVMITQMDLFNRLLGTTRLTAPQFGLAVGSAVLLLVLWELGKLIARRQQESTTAQAQPSSLPAA
jgi:Ca2+-transporting ATPase